MRVRVTALKAPWPPGTQIGDVVDLEGRATVPEWAVGKCEPAPAAAVQVAPADAPVVEPPAAAPSPRRAAAAKRGG